MFLVHLRAGEPCLNCGHHRRQDLSSGGAGRTCASAVSRDLDRGGRESVDAGRPVDPGREGRYAATSSLSRPARSAASNSSKPPERSPSITICGNVNMPVSRRQLCPTVRVLCQIDLLVADSAAGEQRLCAHASRAPVSGVDNHTRMTSQSIASNSRCRATENAGHRAALDSLRRGRPDPPSLHAKARPGVRDRQGRQAVTEPLWSPARAVLPCWDRPATKGAASCSR